MSGQDLAALIGAVQRNCDIADARHAGELTMCIYLLRMRDFYCWEHELPPGREVARDAVGAWMEERERIWQAPSPCHGATVSYDARRSGTSYVHQDSRAIAEPGPVRPTE